MKNFEIQETLSSGSTAKVKRMVSVDNKEYAIKIMSKEKQNKKTFMKEVAIHKSLKNKFIVEFINAHEDLDNFYIVMGLAKYEVYSFIEVDVGIDPTVVHLIFRQLLSALEYLHSEGVCHRDIKPENLLMTGEGNLLLSDFGYSTYFRLNGKTRRLRSMAGSTQYMSPESLAQYYDGEKGDLWSCGVTLVVLLTGTLPWDRAGVSDEKFQAFMALKYHYYPPFNRIRDKILGLIKQLLVPESKRINLKEIMNHPWVRESNRLMGSGGSGSYGGGSGSYGGGSGNGGTSGDPHTNDYSTINDPSTNDPHTLFDLLPHKENIELVFTQPEAIQNKNNNTFISSQPIKSNIFRLYKRGEIAKIEGEVAELLRRMVVPFNRNKNSISFTTTDTKRLILKGEITFTSVNDFVYITINKIKGDNGEFRKFINVFEENFIVDSQ